MAEPERLKNLLVDQGLIGDLGIDEPLVSSGVLSSVDLMKVIGLLEREYDIAVADKDLFLENFETVRRMAELVAQYKKGA